MNGKTGGRGRGARAMTAERAALLSSLGLVAEDIVGTKEAKWNANYEELKAFHAEFGHAEVPSDRQPLHKWLAMQKKKWCWKVSGTKAQVGMTDERVRLLEELGLAVDIPKTPEERWREKYVEVKAFHDVHGHAKLPQGTALRHWVSTQRAKWRKCGDGRGGLTPEQAALMTEELGVDLDSKEEKEEAGEKKEKPSTPQPRLDAWRIMFERLRAYKEEKGDCHVCTNYEPDPRLGRWVSQQRHCMRKYARGEEKSGTTRERVAALRDLGFPLDPPKIKTATAAKSNRKREYLKCYDDIWERRYGELVEFSKEHGHCNVPREKKTLRGWVERQWQEHRGKRRGVKNYLSEDRIAKLLAIGFSFDPPRLDWDSHFDYLVEYQKREGHTRVPPMHQEQKSCLGPWTMRIKDVFKGGKMPTKVRKNCPDKERLAKLHAIGFDFFWRNKKDGADKAARNKKGSADAAVVGGENATVDDPKCKKESQRPKQSEK